MRGLQARHNSGFVRTCATCMSAGFAEAPGMEGPGHGPRPPIAMTVRVGCIYLPPVYILYGQPSRPRSNSTGDGDNSPPMSNVQATAKI
jgi:hypothetical protein